MATITYNVTTVGTPTFNNGVVSNFSNSDYCYITDNITLGSNWEIGIKCNFGSGIPDCCAIAGLGNQYIALGTDPNVNGLNWNIGNGSSWLNPTFLDRSITDNTDYWFKITFNGVQYALYKSTDGINYGSVIAYLDTTTEIPEFQFLIGTGRGLSEVAFPQWIDLRETYIKKNGVEVWRGATVSGGAGVKIQHRRDTSANWALVNPTLLAGEIGYETDTGKAKIGDGSTAWNSLDYHSFRNWVGTLAQYNAITTKDSNTFYNITDDETALSYDAYAKSETYTQAQVNALLLAQQTTFNGQLQSLLNQFYYQPGDSYTFSGSVACPGFITSSGTTLHFTVILPKSLENISTITCSGLTIAIRKPSGGYLPSNNWNAYANATSISLYKVAGNVLDIRVAYSYGETNNISYSIELLAMALNFE